MNVYKGNSLDNKSEEVLPPLMSSKPAVDINGFFDIVGTALNDFIKTEGAPDNTSPVYIEWFPQERIGKPDTAFEVINFSVLEASLSPVLNDGRVNRNPSIRQTEVDKTKEGYNKITYAWWEDYTVQFEIWSKSNLTANKLAVWFHRFLIKYNFFYKFFPAHGIQHFKFEKRLADEVEVKEDQEIYKRRMCYSFRLEMLDTFTSRQLTDLTLEVGTRYKGEVQNIELPAINNK